MSRLNLAQYPWKFIQSVTSHAFEATATRPDKCHLDIKRAVTHPAANKAEPCLTKATSCLTTYHSAVRLVMTHVIELALRVKVWWGLGLGMGMG